MCGIAGIVFGCNKVDLDYIQKMTDALFLRGPDDCGVWFDQDHGVAFGHRRLTVLDLSAAGHQPMHSQTGRYVITYNGEIYNYLEIRNQLLNRDCKFSSHSDTEVILAAFEEWGVVDSIKLFDGMFAFAVWDRQEKKIYLVRDKFGEKPLYYGWVNGTLIFGSELKALREYKLWQPRINTKVLSLFLRYGYISAPYSIYEDVYKLMPGTVLEITANKQERQHQYWSAQEEARQAVERNCPLSETDAVNLLYQHLSQSVQSRCISDVPLGVFLSGGVDSSLIAALAQEHSKQPIKTFTIGFYEKNFNNEAPFAKKIAHYLGTNHTEFYVTEQETQEIIAKLPILYDEPFADSSQIPTHLLSLLARQSVTVCLSGDGGDELFGGYNRYVWLEKVYRRFAHYPRLTRCLLGVLKGNGLDFLNRKITNRLPCNLRIAFLGNKIDKLAQAFKYTNTLNDFYREICSSIHNPADFLLNHEGLIDDINVLSRDWINDHDPALWMMLMDTLSYLPGDILTKVDRAAMGASLEVRAPFLHPTVFRYAWSLPLEYKIKGRQNKYILRKLLYRHIPQQLIERPKVGFGVPIGQWLKGSLRSWAGDLLSVDALRSQGFFDANAVNQCWQEHLSGSRDWTNLLWNFLMFEAWFENNRKI